MELLGFAPGYSGFHGVLDPVRRVRWLSLPLEAIGAAHLVAQGPDVFEPVDCCARLVLVGTQTGLIHSHLFPTGYLFTSWVGSIPGPLSDGVRDLFAAHGSMERPLIVSASANGIVVRTSTGVPVHVLIGPEWSQSRLCRPMPLPGHAMLLVVTDLGRMHLLHAERGIALRSSVDPPHVRRVLAADWLRNDAVVLGHDDGTISIRDSSQLRVLQAEPTRNLSSAPRLPVVDLAVLPESGYVAAVYGVVPSVRIYDIRKGLDGISGGSKQSPAIVQELDVPSADAVIALKWLPQSGSLFTLGVGGNLERFQVSGDAQPLQYANGVTLPAANALYSSFDICSEGDLLAVGDVGGYVRVLALHPSAASVADGDIISAAALERLLAEASLGPNSSLRGSATTSGRHRWLSDIPLPMSRLSNRTDQGLTASIRFPLLASPKAIQSARFIGPIGYLTSTDTDCDALCLQPDQSWLQSIITTTTTTTNTQVQMKLDTLLERVRFRRMDLVKAESLEGFDYALYNRTPFCGLENNLPNSYMNAVLQLLFFVHPFRMTMFSICHRFASTSEEIPTSIAAELGYLYDMLERGGGSACEAARLIYAFQQTPQAVALGLVDDLSGAVQAHSNTPLERRLDKLSRFLLEHLSREESNRVYGSSHGCVTERLFGARIVTRIRAVSSGLETTRVHSQFVLSVSNGTGVVTDAADFRALVAASLQQRLEPIRALHPASQKVELVEQSREVVSLPPYLLCSCTELVVHAIPAELELVPSSGTTYSYRLVGVVAGVRSGDASVTVGRASSFSSAVALVQVKGSQPQDASTVTQAGTWFCFNDFTITPIQDVREVLSYDPSFLQPILLLYQRPVDDPNGEAGGAFPEPRAPIDSEASWERIFALRPLSAVHRRLLQAGDLAALRARLSFVPLAPGERFTPGTLVAMDTEFVLLSREKADILCARRYGKDQRLHAAWIPSSKPTEELLTRRVILEPSRKYVARVTVIRENGQVLLDDYVLPPPGFQIVDYLTRYSGITASDLQPNRTRHYLTLSKYVYAKLHALQRAGCIFVGHGLRSDFRHLNFLLQAEQYRDTAILFRQRAGDGNRGRSRLLSLRFLSGCLLRRNIQNRQQGGHDSSEDAQAALDLYRLYQELERQRTLDATIEQLYEYGSRKNWQPDFSDPFEMVL